MPKRSLIQGAIILFTANLFNRILGFIYQYLIMKHIGSEVYGLYQMVFPLYMTILVFSTAGIPLAVSKMISEKISLGQEEEAKKIFRLAISLLVFLSIVVTLIIYLNSSLIIAKCFPDPRVFYVFRICIPAIFIVSVSSAFRGYFQGHQNMLPSATSQIFEQIFRITTGFFLGTKFLDYGVQFGAAGLALGMLIGELAGLLIIMMHYFASRRKYPCTQSKAEISSLRILKEMFTLSLPVTGSRLVFSGLSALDAFIIPRQLQAAGYSLRHATSLFGELNGTVFTLLSFPSVFTFALATSLVPAISEAIARKEYKTAKIRCADSIRLTIIIGLPCIVILYCYADLLAGIFNSADIAPVLQILSLGGIFTYLHQTTTGILQGLGKTHLPLIHSLIGGAIRIPLMIQLTAIPQLGLIGTAAAYLTGFIIVALLNLIAVCHYVKLKIDLNTIVLKPFTAAAGMMLLILFLDRVIQKTSVGSLLISIAGFTVYIAILFINGGLSINELKKIPFVNGILKQLNFRY